MVFTSVVIPVPKNNNLRQLLAIISCLFCQITVGLGFAWPSPALIKLIDDATSPILITSTERATIATISVIGGIISPILYAILVDKYGRKMMMVLGLLFHSMNWIIAYFGTEVYHLYIARIIFGFALGFSYGLVPTYIGEVTDKHLRGVFGVMTSILFSIGVICEFGVGPYVDFYTLSLLNLIFPVLGILCLVLMPESPYYLVRQKRFDEARRNVMWLRAAKSEDEIQEEMNAIDEFVASSPKRPFLEVMKEMSIYINRLALFLLTVLMIGQQFNGSPVVKTYFHTILEETGTTLDVNLSVVLVETCGLFAMLATFCMVNRVGRKFLFLLTCAGTLIGTFVTGLYFFLNRYNIVGSEASYMAIAGILCIQIFNAFGASTVPTLITSEMSTASIRSWLGAYKTIALSIFNSASIKIFQVIMDGYGVEYSYWLYCLSLVIIIIVLVIIMPETKGKSLQEIQNMLTKEQRLKLKNENHRKTNSIDLK